MKATLTPLPARPEPIGAFLGMKMLTSTHRHPAAESLSSALSRAKAMYTTLLMCTGLTFGSISALFGFTNHIIDQEQYTILVTAVILSKTKDSQTTLFHGSRVVSGPHCRTLVSRTHSASLHRSVLRVPREGHPNRHRDTTRRLTGSRQVPNFARGGAEAVTRFRPPIHCRREIPERLNGRRAIGRAEELPPVPATGMGRRGDRHPPCFPSRHLRGPERPGNRSPRHPAGRSAAASRGDRHHASPGHRHRPGQDTGRCSEPDLL